MGLFDEEFEERLDVGLELVCGGWWRISLKH